MQAMTTSTDRVAARLPQPHANARVNPMINANLMLRGAAACIALAAAGAAQAGDVRTSCDRLHVSDASMVARYSHTPKRATFDVSFKAPGWAAFALGSPLEVSVNGKPVGVLELTEKADGSLAGSLTFDSYANAGVADPSVAEFPANWPGTLPPAAAAAGAAAQVRVGPLGCTLES